MGAHSRGIVHRDIKPANLFLANLPNEGVSLAVVVAFDAAGPSGREPERTRPADPVGADPPADGAQPTGLGGVRIGGIVVGSVGLVLAGAGIGLAVGGLSDSSDALAAFDEAAIAHDVAGQDAARGQ